MDPDIVEKINTVAMWIGYAALAAGVIPHPQAKTAAGVLKGLRLILDVIGANWGQAKNEKGPDAEARRAKELEDAQRAAIEEYKRRSGSIVG